MEFFFTPCPVSVAYGVVGAVVGHVLLGYPLTFISLFGIVALSGVVVNVSDVSACGTDLRFS